MARTQTTLNSRRFFFQKLLGAAYLSSQAKHSVSAPASATPSKWRGFNLIELYNENPTSNFSEWDFKFIESFGFNFVRIPINYRAYTDPNDWLKLNESFFSQYVDRVIELAEKYQIHACINLHRIPGYCINRRDLEPHDLFDTINTDSRKKALVAATEHWQYIANRYKKTPPSTLSFNLINEPPNFVSERSIGIYRDVINTITNAIIKESPARPIIIDGLNAGMRYYNPSQDRNAVILSTRGYSPGQLTHFQASFSPQKEDYKQLAWPLTLNNGTTWNKEKLLEIYQEWIKASKNGQNIIVGEFGVFNTVPHTTTMAYIETLLELYDELHWGWALWNLSGPFGIIDSNRRDIIYKKTDGRDIDVDLLKLLSTKTR